MYTHIVLPPVRRTDANSEQQLDKNHSDLAEVDREQGGLMNQILRLLAIAPSCRDVSASLSEAAAAASLWQPSPLMARCSGGTTADSQLLPLYRLMAARRLEQQTHLLLARWL